MLAFVTELERTNPNAAPMFRAMMMDLRSEEKLFDLETDPRESNPLKNDEGRRERLRAALRDWRERWSSEGNPSGEVRLDPALRERLRGLGYQ